MLKEESRPHTVKLLLTSGHAATTAIAVVEEFLRRRASGEENEIFWIGAKYALEGSRALSLESKIFPKMGIKVFPIVAGRLQRKFTFWTIPSLLKIPVGIVQSVIVISKIRPTVVLSLGGFASFPVVIAAWLYGIPVVIHEQTGDLGLANRLSKPFSKKVLLAKEVGNPVMTQICEVEPKKEIGSPPAVLIMGGSRGSKIINQAVKDALDHLLEKYKIIHITGDTDYPQFTSYVDPNYEAYPWVDPLQIDNFYRQADIVVGRAGANTVSEIVLTGRPAVLIPIPWSPLDEQNKNAQKAKDLGIARIINQNDLSGEKLCEEITQVASNWQRMVAAARKVKSLDRDAAGRVVDALEAYL